MPTVDITRLVSERTPLNNYSGSIAELGQGAGAFTWVNCCRAVKRKPFDFDNGDRAGLRDYFRGFGAWDSDQIDSWSDVHLDALVFQYAVGELRTLQAVCPGTGLAGVDWTRERAACNAGCISGNLYESAGKLWIDLCD